MLDETDSTMAEAARRNLTEPTWIMARAQTAAHGRRGRAWSSPASNFAATLVLQPKCTPQRAALRSFIAAIALYRTLAMCVDPDRISLKWPNDVLIDERKVAGILLEASGGGAAVDRLAIGIGVNLTEAPMPSQIEPGAVPPISVAEAGRPLNQDDMLFWLAVNFAEVDTRFVACGFADIRDMWLQHAARLGQRITARTGKETREGIFETVDAEGNLVLKTPDGPVPIAAADIYF